MHGRRFGGLGVLFIQCPTTTESIEQVGQGLNPEARATSRSPGFEIERVVAFAEMLPTVPLRPLPHMHLVGRYGGYIQMPVQWWYEFQL
jgi:hypothetical protein